jgi:hypothetical protein
MGVGPDVEVALLTLLCHLSVLNVCERMLDGYVHAKVAVKVFEMCRCCGVLEEQ